MTCASLASQQSAAWQALDTHCCGITPSPLHEQGQSQNCSKEDSTRARPSSTYSVITGAQQPAYKTLAHRQLGLKPQTTNPGLEAASTSQGSPTYKNGYPTRTSRPWRMGGHPGETCDLILIHPMPRGVRHLRQGLWSVTTSAMYGTTWNMSEEMRDQKGPLC